MNIKFISFYQHALGKRSGMVIDDDVFDITPRVGNDLYQIIKDNRINTQSFLREMDACSGSLLKLDVGFGDLQNYRHESLHLLIPYYPPEVWGVGVTYRRNMEIHENDMKENKKNEGLYAYVYDSVRPEIFFKALPHHCIGTHSFFTIRKDSECTIVEAELACIYSAAGEIVAYTAANDITAWDIELACPLFLNYAKIFDGGCILGPAIVPAITIAQPKKVSVHCKVIRDGREVYNEEGNTRNMKRSFEELTSHLFCNRTIPDGAMLCTGTAVGIPSELACEDGDEVHIEIEGIGKLINTGRQQ